VAPDDQQVRDPFGGKLQSGRPDDRPETLTVIDRKAGRTRVLDVGDPGWFTDLSFRPGGRELYAVVGGHPTLYDLQTGQSRLLRLEGYESAYAGPVWSPDGRRVALARLATTQPKGVREWDIRTGKLVREWGTLHPRPGAIGYNAEGRLLVWNRVGVRLDVQDAGGPEQTPPGHRDYLTDVAFAPGDMLVTLDNKRLVCRWDLRTGKLVDRQILPEAVHSKKQTYAATNWQLDPRDGTAFLRAGPALARFDLDRRGLDPLRETPLNPDDRSLDGRWLLEWNEGGGRLFDTERGRQVTLPPVEQLWPRGKGDATFPFWSPDGRWLAATTVHMERDDRDCLRLEIAVVKLPTARLFARVEVESHGSISMPLFTPDGSTLLLGHDGKIDAFDPATGSFRRQYKHPAENGVLVPCTVSPDSRLLLVRVSDVPTDARYELIEMATGSVRRRLTLPPGLHGGVRPRFSPDGRCIAFTRTDATVLLIPVDDETAPPPDRAALWRDLSSPDAAVAGLAVQALASRPDAVRWVQARLGASLDRPPEPELPALFWLAELDHEEPARREAARRHLAGQPERLADLEAALTGEHSPEVRRALTDLRETAQEIREPAPGWLRLERLREVLERLGSEEARALRDRLR
jgi:WD40 repeat protein